NKGNLDFNPDNIIMCPTTSCPKAVTGKYAYEFSASHSNTYAITTGPLNAKEYILSFWCTDDAGSILDVSLNNGTTSLSTIQTSVVNTVGNWKLRIAKFTAASNDFILIKNIPGVTTSVSTYIDEVRIFPVGATMNTYSYKPLFGLGSE